MMWQIWEHIRLAQGLDVWADTQAVMLPVFPKRHDMQYAMGIPKI